MPASASIGDADAVFEGEESEDRAGDQVSRAGDINGDGFDDLLVGAPSSRLQNPEGGAGRVYLVPGGPRH